MKNFRRYTFRIVGATLLIVGFPACYYQTEDTAKQFYLEQMEKTDAWQKQHAQREEKKEEKKEAKAAEKQSEPAPARLVPDSK